MSKNTTIPKEIERYMASSATVYEGQEKTVLQSVIVNSTYHIEEYSFDNWDGGQYGFMLRLHLPGHLFSEISKNKTTYEKDICETLNSVINIQNEFIECVSIEMVLTEDDQWRQESGLLQTPLLAKKYKDETIIRIWGDTESFRLFLSHKSEFKKETVKLKDALRDYGISCFVAHKDIEPTQEWQNEIERALFSMDALAAVMTPDFSNSNWTDQEIGVAVGRQTPVLSIRMGQDPYGFIGKYQAMTGTWQDIHGMASEIFEIIAKHPLNLSKVKKQVFILFRNSPSFGDSGHIAKNILPKLGKFDDTDIQYLLNAFNQNDQLHNCYNVKRYLTELLREQTKMPYMYKQKTKTIELPQVPVKNDIPF